MHAILIVVFPETVLNPIKLIWIHDALSELIFKIVHVSLAQNY